MPEVLTPHLTPDEKDELLLLVTTHTVLELAVKVILLRRELKR